MMSTVREKKTGNVNGNDGDTNYLKTKRSEWMKRQTDGYMNKYI